MPIGHLKEAHRLGLNHLAGTIGDSAVGYNFRRILKWIALLFVILITRLGGQKIVQFS